MPAIISQSSQNESEYNQVDFSGGLNLLLDDTHLQPNQYRVGFNLRNRYDRLDLIPSSKLDIAAPNGVKQEMVTFGNYEIIFVQGFAWYKLYNELNWHQVQGFQMDPTVPRYWTEQIPVATTNYLRQAIGTALNPTIGNARSGIQLSIIAGAAQGNLSGLLIQDGINQPQFIFIGLDRNNNLVPICRTTQDYNHWNIVYTDNTKTVIANNGDLREYVPIGTFMKFVDGVLYVVDPTGNFILRSVSGRPLDFVIAVAPDGTKAGNAYTTSYSVGVGPITCLKGLSDNSLFVAASNANFSVSKNMTQNAPTEFGEYTFIRKFLFNANCLSDRAIIDTLGDTRFIDITGVRSFNAVQQTQNEGRNSVFTATIQGAFTDPNTSPPTQIVQDPNACSAILFNDFELYAVNTLFGPAILVYDTTIGCWSSIDVSQVGGKLIKKLVKIELAVQALFAITVDDKVYQLYSSSGTDIATVRTVGVCSGLLWAGTNVKMANPAKEVKLNKTRIIINNITQSGTVTFTPYVDNRMSGSASTKKITFTEPINPTTGILALSDVDTMLRNVLFSSLNCQQGWKVFGLISWNTGSITQFSMQLVDHNPQNPLSAQADTVS